MIFPDQALATRFEHHLAQDMQGYVHAFHQLFPDYPTDDSAIAGGVAICMGADYLNIAVGIGMGESVTSDDIDQLEAFFKSHQTPVQIELSAFTDDTLLHHLNARGYHLVDFTTAYTHSLETIPDTDSEIIFMPIDASQHEIWVRTVNDIAPDDDTSDTRLAQAVTHRANTTCFLATIDGVPVGASALSIRDDIAILYFTATRQAYRGQGVQTAMIQARLHYAKTQSCEVVFATTNPGVQSMRNLLRAGFQVAYTRCMMQQSH